MKEVYLLRLKDFDNYVSVDAAEAKRIAAANNAKIVSDGVERDGKIFKFVLPPDLSEIGLGASNV